MAVIHISEADAARDFGALMIGPEAAPVAVLKPADGPHVRKLSESLRMARERGSTVTLDGEFGRDLEAIIESHSEPLKNPWD